MKSKNKIVIKGMRFVAVLSILSMTVFSSSLNVAYAHNMSGESSYSQSSHDEGENKSEHYKYNDDESTDNESDYHENDGSSWSNDEHNDHDSDSTKSDTHENEQGDDHSGYHSKDKSEDKNSENDNNGKDHDKVTICHATHSDSNPYVEITISVSGKDAHKHHQDEEDIIPAPKDGCPKGHDDNDGDHGNHGGDDNHGGNGGNHDGDGDEDGEHESKNTAPVITLVGDSTIYVDLGQTYVDQGATANDKEDGDITSEVVSISNVDTSVAGTYTVTYNVKDSRGLCAEEVTRTVIVMPAGDYNHAPVITLLGLNPITINVGDIYLDPGATAYDNEDGDITSNIVKTGSVDINTPGTYTITYNVVDSKGLAAETVTRTVIVLPVNTGSNTGKITFCMIVGDSQNVVATSSYALPQGTFTINLATTTSNIASTTIRTKIWNSETFTPNQKVILNENDSDCVTYDNLEYGEYLYSPVSINGASWNTAKYNDQNDQPVNNVFDFFPYGDINTNSDGVIIINADRSERTLYVYNTYKAGPACELPEITSSLSTNATVGQNFTLDLVASSTSSVNWDVATTSLPAGLAFATTTNTISGIPTQTGTYNIALKAINTCGFVDGILVITVGSGGNGGGGSSPSANLSVVKTANKTSANVGDEVTYTISLENKGPDEATNVKVTDVLPSQLDFVSASTSFGAYATTTSVWSVGTLANGSTTSLVLIVKVKSGTEGQKISNTANATSDQSDSDSSNNTSTVDVNVINPTVGNGGGGGTGTPAANGPIAGSYSGSGGGIVASVIASDIPVVQGCNYLLDYLRRDFNNNPIEVLKLQSFLRTYEGFSDLLLTGVYDQATIDAVNVFQMRYKDDVLTPWGHTAPTSYVYILTKKKVNEIYCKLAFPVTTAQQEEIDGYRNSHTGSYVNTGTPTGSDFVTNDEVGYGSTISDKTLVVSTSTNKAVGSTNVKTATTGLSNVANVGLTTLAGFSSSTKNIASDFVANIISSGKKIGNLLGALFSLPAKLFEGDNQNICKDNTNLLKGLNIILLLVIIALSYMWYKSHRNNKKLEEINKEIDLQK